MEANGLIAKGEEVADGKKVTTIYKSPHQKGFNFLPKYLNRMKKDVCGKNKKGDKRIYRQTRTLMLFRLLQWVEITTLYPSFDNP